MDLSGLIFVALAIAWAAYLIPKALHHHDDVARGRSVDRFSQSMRVLARREPVSARSARLIVAAEPPTAAATPRAQQEAFRRATSRATRRRRRVISIVLLALVATVAACATGRLAWPYVAIPAAVLVVWLVACRLMVKRERAWLPAAATDSATADTDEADATATTGTIAPVAADESPDAEGLWDPVPVTLPTYVSKPPARRSIRTIDLDSTGVWTSGRSESDSALAREAEAADRARRRTTGKAATGDEAVGS